LFYKFYKGALSMAATVQAQIGTGSSVSWANAETGAKFNREDTLAGTTPIPIPTATGENYSWIKNFVLAVTGTSTTNISNRNIYQSGATATGLYLYFKFLALGSYAQSAVGNMPAGVGTNSTTPATYTLMTTSPQLYDNTSVATNSTGPNGGIVVCDLGVDHLFVGGPGNATALPSLILQYDEA
jgi:hypothetical protein